MSRLRKASSMARDWALVRYKMANWPFSIWCCIFSSQMVLATNRPSSLSVMLRLTFILGPKSLAVQTTLSSLVLFLSMIELAASTMFLVER